MKHVLIIFCLALVWLVKPELIFSQSDGNGITYEEFYKQFSGMTIDSGKTRMIKQFNLMRDVGSITLDSGIIYYMKPINGKVCVALFTGKGSFFFSPPVKIEKENLKRVYKKDYVDEQFIAMLLIFNDSTEYELNAASTPIEMEPHRITEKYIHDARQYLIDNQDKAIPYAISKSILESTRNDYFYAQFIFQWEKPLMWVINPYATEEVRFSKGDWYGGQGFDTYNICSFHTQDEYNKNDFDPDTLDKNEILIEKNLIDYRINPNLSTNGTTISSFKVLLNNIEWLDFSLASRQKVDSVIVDDKKCVFYRPEDRTTLWIKMPSKMKKDETHVIKICYNGKDIYRVKDNMRIRRGISTWYPAYNRSINSSFDVTFHYPINLKLISMGNMVALDTVKEIVNARWQTDYPVNEIVFDIGTFSERKYNDESTPELYLYYTNLEHIENIENHLLSCFKFFQLLLGKCKNSKILISKSSDNGIFTLPGFISCPSKNMVGLAEQIAAQWWSYDVDYKTYHDAWVIDGLDSYLPLLYFQLSKNDNKTFFENLLSDKEDIQKYLKKVKDDGRTPGTMFLNTGLPYQKSRWFMHMLRMMLLDLNSLHEEAFFTIINKLYNDNKNRKISNGDFLKCINEVTGVDFSWFFEEWVYNSEFPKYKVAYKTSKTQEGKYNVRCRFSQKDVPPEFAMFMNLKVDFEDKTNQRLRVLLKGASAEFDLPLFDKKPKEVIFNDFESVLCDIETEDWE